MATAREAAAVVVAVAVATVAVVDVAALAAGGGTRGPRHSGLDLCLSSILAAMTMAILA